MLVLLPTYAVAVISPTYKIKLLLVKSYERVYSKSFIYLFINSQLKVMTLFFKQTIIIIIKFYKYNQVMDKAI